MARRRITERETILENRFIWVVLVIIIVVAGVAIYSYVGEGK